MADEWRYYSTLSTDLLGPEHTVQVHVAIARLYRLTSP